jgi:predicted AAA+ superfamily ATPase
MIQRKLLSVLQAKLNKRKAIILIGARQVGKTTLLKQIPGFAKKKILWLNGDEADTRALFQSASVTQLKKLIGKNEIVIVDEAQRIKNIGVGLKLITDGMPEVQLLVTGSSSLELNSTINEPLTGRKWEYQLYPLSFAEMVNHHGLLEEKRLITHRLLYGYFPDVINHPGEEREILTQLTDSFLYKDVLSLDSLKKPIALQNLLRALAFQVGSQVSYNELSQVCSMDVKTVEKYIGLLEQTYVLFRMSSYHRNLRGELSKSKKIYFYDTGVRNALINNFNTPEFRQDIGGLWENFLVVERMKYLAYSGRRVNSWFWRTVGQQEIDLIEEENGAMRAFEFKWNSKAKVKLTPTFANAYPEASFEVIHPGNMEEFVGV